MTIDPYDLSLGRFGRLIYSRLNLIVYLRIHNLKIPERSFFVKRKIPDSEFFFHAGIYTNVGNEMAYGAIIHFQYRYEFCGGSLNRWLPVQPLGLVGRL